MTVTPRGMSVQEAYRSYREGAFRVNRQYQRKLVWTLEEKQKLIDSLLRGYPVPLILLATHVDEGGAKSFEILDGMQRLNAIFGFIENQFDVEGEFFDTDQLSRAKQLVEEGVFTVQDNVTQLSAARCADLLDYTLAVTEFPAATTRIRVAACAPRPAATPRTTRSLRRRGPHRPVQPDADGPP